MTYTKESFMQPKYVTTTIAMHASFGKYTDALIHIEVTRLNGHYNNVCNS